MSRPLSSFPIPPNVRNKLQKNKFSSVEDLKGIRPLDLSKEIDVTQEESLAVMKVVFPEIYDGGSSSEQKKNVTTFSLKELIEKEQTDQPIITFSEKIDEALGGGIHPGKITEICGAPGTGKTQMCLQLAVDVQIPKAFGGTEGEALLVDTEGSFTIGRLKDLAEAAVHHCGSVASQEKNPETDDALEKFTVASILKGIHYYRSHNSTDLIAIVNLVQDFLEKHPKVKLIIVDSIAFPFRHEFDGVKLGLRTRVLNGLAQNLLQVAVTQRLAVVLTNHMTTKVESEGSSHLIPALGESWGHVCTVRLILSWIGGQRCATLFKSPWCREMTVPYQIVVAGIRDVSQDKRTLDGLRADSNQSLKRCKIENENLS